MSRPSLIDFDALRISTPCTVSWDAMEGDPCKRFCGQCKLNVYDVSEMTRGQAETLIRKSEGRVCLRLHRRTDGRIVTKDCGRVRLAIERRIRWMRTAAAALFAAMGLASCHRGDGGAGAALGATGDNATTCEQGDVAVPPPRPMMGLVAPKMGEAIAPPRTPADPRTEMEGVPPEPAEVPAERK